MKVLKFGGTSIATPERISKVMDILDARTNTEDTVSVIFSAYAGITDQLIQMGNRAAQSDEGYLDLFKKLEQRHLRTVQTLLSVKSQSATLANIKIRLNELEEILQGVFLVKELTSKTLDYIMSFGERLSAYTISEALVGRGIPNIFIDSREMIRTDASFGKAKVDFKETNMRIKRLIGLRKNLFVITGFIASTSNNETTTLGRGGSDYSASIIGAALNADEIEIWTDVDGVLTADPGKVKNAIPIDHLTYEEAMELSHFGAKVIYPPTMQPALNKHIPLRVKNTFNPDFKGSVINRRKNPSSFLIKGISSIDEVALIRIQGSGMIGIAGIAERMFNTLAREKINIILISQASSEHSICLAVMPEHKQIAKKVIEEEFKYELKEKAVSEIIIETDLTILAVVGENMRHTPGIAGKVFQSLGNNGINISAIAQGSSELNISMVISRKDEVKALNVLHESFFLSGRKTINLFLVGTGLIGKTFLDQLCHQAGTLTAEYRLLINLIGLANSRQMVIHTQGIDLGKWDEVLAHSRHKSDIDKFIEEMRSCNLPNSIFIDCTKEDAIADRYLEILKSDICIVTPNKKANVKKYSYYKRLHEYASKLNSRFLYETNVGAALPIISTIKDLMAGGDKVVKFEGILSGSLSYILNTFTGREPFSSIILQAREKGYTEPDPREDLSGKDAARKLLILIREAGYKMEMADIKIENLIPAKARQALTVDEFFNYMKEYDVFFEKKRARAQKNGRVLRYIARFENNKAVVSLCEVESNHPFYDISVADNIISISTNRYSGSPLIIRGPGAGASVTAAGVLSDILKIATYSN